MEFNFTNLFLCGFFSDTGLRVHSSSNENDKDHPLLVVVKQEKGILSWQIPFFIKREDAR